MKTLLSCLALMMIPLCNLPALDITLVNGATFKDVVITQKTPVGINFLCNGSAGWVNYIDMPIEDAKKLGYDPDAAAQFEEKLEKNKGCMMPDSPSPADVVPANSVSQPASQPNIDNTLIVTPSSYIPYDPALLALPGIEWVSWNGHCYPYNWWHNWYWNNHWTYWNGRYYPSHFVHQNGVWHDGKYYPYKHNLLKNHPGSTGMRMSSTPHNCSGHYGGHGGRR